MLRKLLAACVVVVLLGLGTYFIFFKGKGTELQDPARTASAGEAQPMVSATKTPPPDGEFWTERCNKDGGDKHCEVFQRLTVTQTKQRLIEFAVGYPKDSADAQAAVLLPLGVLVSEGMMISVDGGEPAKTAIRTCGPAGCIVIANIPGSLLGSMEKGKVMVVSFFDAGTGKRVDVQMSLSGFGDKLKALTK